MIDHNKILNLLKPNKASYPIILIPQVVAEALSKQYSTFDLENINGNVVDSLKRPKSPYNEAKYLTFPLKEVENEIQVKSLTISPDFDNLSSWRLLLIYPVALVCYLTLELWFEPFKIFISQRYSLLWFCMFVAIVIWILFFLNFKVVAKNKIKIKKIPDNEFIEQQDDYYKKKSIADEKYKKELLKYNIDLKVYNTYIKDRRTCLELKGGYYPVLTPKILPNKDIVNIKRGASELYFLDYLVSAFGKKIKVDRSVTINNINYQPDFILDNNRFCIDIEIDEPYAFEDGSPIHYIGKDDYRNDNFLSINWFVIRFSEKQIKDTPLDCITTIRNFESAIVERSATMFSTIKHHSQWTYEESLVMSLKATRVR